MLKTFTQLLGTARPVFHRYLWLAVAYGLLCGLTISTLLPLLRSWLQGDAIAALYWLTALVFGVFAS